MKKAQEFLVQIPDAKEELVLYVWWWETQGRTDLSENAKMALDSLEILPSHEWMN